MRILIPAANYGTELVMNDGSMVDLLCSAFAQIRDSWRTLRHTYCHSSIHLLVMVLCVTSILFISILCTVIVLSVHCRLCSHFVCSFCQSFSTIHAYQFIGAHVFVCFVINGMAR